MKKIIRIGTRDSELALWQANTVKSKLENLGYATQLVPVKSQGDLVLDKPLYEIGITGIFTKTLDIAMINGTVDIAVHSMKDVPTRLPNGIVQTAVLERASSGDVLVSPSVAHGNKINWENPCTIASGSLRRKAQWLHRYPHHTVVDLRGNVNTRLQKLKNNQWDGAIFAKAGLERLGFLKSCNVENADFKGAAENLDWMLPAPAQGAMVVVALQQDEFSVTATSKLNHAPSQICTHIERDFLRTLEGGCTAPIGAYAEIIEDRILFKGCLFSVDGETKLEIEKEIALTNLQVAMDKNGQSSVHEFGMECAQEILRNGGVELMRNIKKQMQ